MIELSHEPTPSSAKPSRTAWRVAALRAVHQLLDDPIVLPDPFALPILGDKAEAELRQDPFHYNDPLSRGLRAAVVVRSRVAEDEVARAVAVGVRQYVVLGAGLDTFAYRNPYATDGLHVFEVDHPVTQDWKHHNLAAAGIRIGRGVTYAPVDFERHTLAAGLDQAGFRRDRPACFSWLGVTMYLTEAAIVELLGFVASLPPQSSITFDFRVPPAMMNPIQRATAEVLAHRAAALGEPWISAFGPAVLKDKLTHLGFREVEVLEPDALNHRYLDRRKDGLHTSGWLMRARV